MKYAVAKMRFNSAQFVMWLAQQVFEQAKLVHDLERRRMNGVAAKIAKEILVFLKDGHFHAGASQKKSQHHTSRSAAGNATRSAFVHGMFLDIILPTWGQAPSLPSPSEREQSQGLSEVEPPV